MAFREKYATETSPMFALCDISKFVSVRKKVNMLQENNLLNTTTLKFYNQNFV